MENISLSANDRLQIGLISDTHLHPGMTLDGNVAEVFRDADLILHAGDIYDFAILNELERIAPVLAARGDDDSIEIIDDRVKESYLLNIGPLTIWLQHRMPLGMIPLLYAGNEPEIADLVRKRCPVTPDIVVFGDTHRTFVKNLAGILFINPGSPTLPEYANKPGTLVLLNITSGEAKTQIVQLG
jgi:uncharacterized protein